MKSINFIIIYFMLSLPYFSFAAPNLKSTVEVPKYKASASSLYYDFKGHRPAESGVYGFERVSYAIWSLNLSYFINPSLIITATGRYVRNYAETRFYGQLFKDENEGFSDTKLKLTKNFFSATHFSMIDLGLSLPTGSIDKKNPHASSYNYPYNMQLGSGTTDIELSLMRLNTFGKNQLGSFAMATWRMGRNSYDYRKGDEYIAKIWYNYLLSPYFNPGIWLNYWHVQRLTGADKTYGRLEVVEFYHSSRHFIELTPHVTGRYPITKDLALNFLSGRPIFQRSKNRDNVQVYAQWFAQIGFDGVF
jgi:hypothetical protein